MVSIGFLYRTKNTEDTIFQLDECPKKQHFTPLPDFGDVSDILSMPKLKFD